MEVNIDKYLFILYKITYNESVNTNSKTTLIVDGNWLLMSRFFILKDLFLKSLGEDELKNSTEALADLMAQSISIILRQFNPIITNIVLVSDGRSWRKELPTPLSVQSETYKGNREKEQSEDYDWGAIFKGIEVLTNRFKNLNITTSNNWGIEGDDWCWWWSRKLNSEGTNVILWTSDEDVKQLVQEDKDTGAYTAWYEKTKGIVLHSSLNSEIPSSDEYDLFMSPIVSTRPDINKLKKIVKVSYVNPATIINKKIYIGDAGDNILPTFTYKKKEKTYKATRRDWEKLLDFNKTNYDSKEWEENLGNIYDSIYNIKKNSIEDKGVSNIISKKDFIEHVIYNRKMVWLNESQIPENIQTQMMNSEYIEISEDLMHDLRYNWKTMGRKDNMKEIENLFENSRF